MIETSSRYATQRGLTLIELVIAMVVVSIALAGVLLVMNFTTRHSADPMLTQQAVAIAEAYLEEITLKPYLDPDTGALCPAPEANRKLYDNVCDYNGLSNSGARNQNDVAIVGLEHYTVNVAVAGSSFGAPAVNGLKISVSVTDPTGGSLSLTSYRTAD